MVNKSKTAGKGVDEEDPRFPGGMNYLDWLFMVLTPDERTPQNIDQIIAYIRKARDSAASGVKAKKADPTPRVDLVAKAIQMGLLKAKPTLKRRPIKQ